MAGGYLPLAAVLLLVAATTVLAATSAVPVGAATAAAADKYSGRMVIIHAPGSSRSVSAGGALIKRQQQQQRRLVEDEVTPEFGSLLGVANGGSVSDEALKKDRPICINSCAARGGRYTPPPRPCASYYDCPHTSTAGHARAVHV